MITTVMGESMKTSLVLVLRLAEKAHSVVRLGGGLLVLFPSLRLKFAMVKTTIVTVKSTKLVLVKLAKCKLVVSIQGLVRRANNRVFLGNGVLALEVSTRSLKHVTNSMMIVMV